VVGYRDGHRVDGKIAPQQVVDQGVAEGDLRVAGLPVVLVGPERGDLDLGAGLGRADGAERDAGLPGRLTPGPQQREDLRRPRIGGEIQIVPEPAQQGVPHRPADQVQLVARGLEPAAQLVGQLRYRQAAVLGQNHVPGRDDSRGMGTTSQFR